MRILTIFCAGVLLLGCTARPAPEEAVRQWLADAQAAVEERNRSRLLDMISERYVDGRGNRRDEIGQKLRLYFLAKNNITLVTNVEELTVIDDTIANVMLTVAMGGMQSDRFGFSASAYKFDLELEKGNDRWQLIGARWARLGDELR